jgi:Rrf2 family protein
MPGVRVSAKVDYAVRACLELAAANGGPLKGEQISTAQDIPLKFLENILIDLRHADLVKTQRGPEGGYWLARPADEIFMGEVIRAVEGPLASVRGEAPENLAFAGSVGSLQEVWIALRASLRSVLDEVSLAAVMSGKLPPKVSKLTEASDAWARR